jgi:hypothetical protein
MKVFLKILIWVGLVLTLFYSPMFFHNNFGFLNPYVSIIIANFSVFYIVLTIFYLIHNYKQSQKIFRHQKKFIKGYWYYSIILLLIVSSVTYFVGKNTNRDNFKNDSEVTQFEDYTHPIIRYYTSIFSIFDSDIIITDSKREIEDYDKMGLKRLETSMHLIQEDGYSHALDLRTRDKSRFYVFILTSYYDLLGFYTLEHDGTAMHLHVHIK